MDRDFQNCKIPEQIHVHENLCPIPLRRLSLKHEVIKVDGHWKQHITVKVKDHWKPLENFIKEDIKESYHQMIRGNVNMATSNHSSNEYDFSN